jgi:Cd2+/Zn2+-exporting ATPase
MGIIIKGGVYLEQAAKLDWVAFDKTGTITTGVPLQTDQVTLDESQGFYAIAASLAHRSDHPVSSAIVRSYRINGEFFHDVSAFRALPGRGVQGTVNGVAYHLGNHHLIEELGICNKDLEARLEALESEGKTTVILADATKPLMVFAVADTIKETSRQAMTELHGLGVKSLMLSGDNSRTAEAIGKQAGIDQIQGDQLPEDKAQAIKRLREEKQIVGMVGDGINDAPALAHADIGIAMGGIGSDAAIETADVVLMDDDLRKVPALIELSRRTRRILGQNITVALGLKLIFLVITLLGFGTMWMAVFADMGASLIVVFNGLRLMTNRSPMLFADSECTRTD